MRNAHLKIIVFFLAVMHICPYVQADELIMATGERFTSSEIWEEGNKIRFNMQGIVVSVDKSDVVKIIRSSPSAENQPTQPDPVTAPRFDHQSVPTPSKDDSLSKFKPQSTPAAHNNDQRKNPLRSAPQHRKPHTAEIGLDGVVWRMPTTQMQGIEKIETDPAFGGIDQYYLPDQPLMFAGAPIDGLVYGFWQNQLYSVMIWNEGRIGYRQLKHGIFSAYGRGIQRRLDVERYVWDEPQTQRMLEFDEERKIGLFIMRSTELDAVIKERYPVSSNR